MENGPAVDLVMLICSWVGIVVFDLIVNAHKTDGKMSSVLLCNVVPGRGRSFILKKPWGRRMARVPVVYLRKTWCRRESTVFRRDLQEKKLCTPQSSWMRQQPALFPSKCLSTRTNTWEECPAALRHHSTPSLDEARSWKALTHLSKTTGDGNWSWKILW